MEFIVCSLAVYKTLQVINSLLPKEPMPWVKILAGVLVGYGAAALAGLDKIPLSGLAVATVAGSVHALLRLITLTGDLAQRKSLR
jgi:hypothetical protein